MKFISVYVGLLLVSVFLVGCNRHLAQGEPQPIPTFSPPTSAPKIALVLGGGGSKGLAHVGVLHELEQAGIHPDFIVGCSAGALVGALYADQPDVDRLEPLLMNLKRSDIMDFSLFASPFGMVKGHSLANFLEKNLKAKTFQELHIPLIVVATDLHTGELIEFGGGPLIPALCASAAVPGVFKPVFYLGRHLVDGGAVDPVPVRIAKKYGAKIIIAVDVGEKLSKEDLSHFLGVARRGLNISYRQLSLQSTLGADVVIRMDFEGLGMFTDRYNKQIYEHGRIKTRETLPHLEGVITGKLSPKLFKKAPSWLLIE